MCFWIARCSKSRWFVKNNTSFQEIRGSIFILDDCFPIARKSYWCLFQWGISGTSLGRFSRTIYLVLSLPAHFSKNSL